MNNLYFKKISARDSNFGQEVTQFTEMSKRSFEDDSLKFMTGIGGPPGYQDVYFTKKMAIHCDVFLIYAEEENFIPVAGLISYPVRGKRELGRLFVDPNYQKRGYGIELMKQVEKMYPEEIFQLDTPKQNYRTNCFYPKCGYEAVATDNEFVYYQKKVHEKWKE
jgi:GNAT superfamily N-acetyltransferase